jgi:hypothetical protein
MNKFLVISIITLIFVGTSPVSAWSPFEHSTKDWDWKDWSFLAGMIAAGVFSLIAGGYGIYRAYKSYQYNKLNRMDIESMSLDTNMADRFVKQHPDWTTDPIRLDQSNSMKLINNPHEIKGLHTIEFTDGSKASIFHDILTELHKIDAALQTIYDDSNTLIRETITLSGNVLATIDDFYTVITRSPIDNQLNVGSPHTDVVSTLHQFLPFEGMDEVLPGLVRETFVFRKSMHITPQEVFGQTLADHMLERSYFVNHNRYGGYGGGLKFTNQKGPYKYQ